MSDPARQMIRQALEGDRDAAERLIDAFHRRIYAYHHRLSGNASDAEDLTQLTFAKAWESLARFEGRSTVSAWLHGIAYHVFIDWLRKRRPVEHPDANWWDACPDPGRPFDNVTARDSAATVWSAADKLPDDLRWTIHLHYYQELTLQETADALGIAVSTVKFRVTKAIGLLQKELAEPGLKSNTAQP